MRSVLVVAALVAACAAAERDRASTVASPSEPLSCGPSTGTPIPFDDRMTHPSKIAGPDPVLTSAGWAQHEGTVRAICRVTVDGCVDECRIVKSDPSMDAAFVNALQRRRYRPVTLDGKPVEVEYMFRLQWKVAPTKRGHGDARSPRGSRRRMTPAEDNDDA